MKKEKHVITNINEIASRTLTEDEEIYKENILEHYKYPQNKREMKECTVKHREFNPLCGDDITLFIKIENEKIKALTFLGHGCAISQASISMLTEKVKGMKIEEAKVIKQDDILVMLGIPINVVRMKCALLSLKALTKGLEKQ